MSALRRYAIPVVRPSKAALLPPIDATADDVADRMPEMRPSAIREVRAFAGAYKVDDDLPTALPSWSWSWIIVGLIIGLLMWAGIIWTGWQMYLAVMDAIQRAADVQVPW